MNTQTFTTPREILSYNGFFSTDLQATDLQAMEVVAWMKKNHPTEYANLHYLIPKLDEVEFTGSWFDTEAMGVDEEWGSWLVDAIEETGLVIWDDGKPYANTPVWSCSVEVVEREPFVMLEYDDDSRNIVGGVIVQGMMQFRVWPENNDDYDYENPQFIFNAVWHGGAYADLMRDVVEASDLVVGGTNQWVGGDAADVINLVNGKSAYDEHFYRPYKWTEFVRACNAHAGRLVREYESVEHDLANYGFEV